MMNEIEIINYKELCLEAINYSSFNLNYVNPKLLSYQDYKNLCLIAVNDNDYNLHIVNYKYLIDEDYEDLLYVDALSLKNFV